MGERLTPRAYVLPLQNGLNALHLAAKEGHVDLVQELLERGASVDSATKVGHLCSGHGRGAIIWTPLSANRETLRGVGLSGYQLAREACSFRAQCRPDMSV